MLMAILLYDVMGAIIKHLTQNYPAQQLSLFRNFFGLIPTLLFLAWTPNMIKAGKPRLKRIAIKQWKLALARGGMGAMAQLCFYLALLHLEIATATTIVFAGPLFITALSIPVLGQRVGLWRWLAVVIGFIGVVLIISPSAQNFSWVAVLPLCAAFGYAGIAVTSRLFDKTIPTAVINLYSNIGSLIGSAALVVFTSSFVQILPLQDWLWLVAMGIAGGTASFCLVSAYRMADPGSLSPFEYFGIPFSFFLGWYFFSETPFDRLIPGAFLIVGGGLVIIWREHFVKQRKSDVG